MECLPDVGEYVSECLQLAMLLEVSAYPKPGNVHRTADFGDTRYEHFLSSAVVVGGFFRKAAERGVLIGLGKLNPDRAEVGEIIRKAVGKISSWINSGNTVLGTLILLAPLAVAAGANLVKGKKISVKQLRQNLRLVVETTTPIDAINLYEAIQLAKPGGLGKAPELDVNDPYSKEKILKCKISLFEVFRIASSYDSIAAEWTNDYPITFDMGYPYFIKELKHARDFNTATVHVFLKILSEVPDTLIARKAGKEIAEKISLEAKEILSLGGLTTIEGRKRLFTFDDKLRKAGNMLNPGTTADLVSAVLAVGILEGYRP